MKRAFVTGPSGFVGPHLVRELVARGYDVCAFDRPRAGTSKTVLGVTTTFGGDLLDFGSLRAAIMQAKPDVVFHLAAQSHVGESWRQPAQTIEVNALGTLHLLEAVRAECSGAVVQLAGSSEEYGLVQSDELPIRETNALRPLSPYAVSKVATDLLGYQYNKSYGLRVVRTRAFNHEGPGRPESFVPSGFAAQIARIEAGRQTPVIQHGNLDAIRDYTDVRDIARAYVLAVERGALGEVYNICSGTGQRLGDALDMLIVMAAVKVDLREDPTRMRPSDVPRLVGDSTKFRVQTGWSPEIAWETTLRDLLEWWRMRVAHEAA